LIGSRCRPARAQLGGGKGNLENADSDCRTCGERTDWSANNEARAHRDRRNQFRLFDSESGRRKSNGSRGCRNTRDGLWGERGLKRGAIGLKDRRGKTRASTCVGLQKRKLGGRSESPTGDRGTHGEREPLSILYEQMGNTGKRTLTKPQTKPGVPR